MDQFCWDVVTPADFPFFNDCTAASTSLRRIGWSSSVSVWIQFSTDGSPLAFCLYPYPDLVIPTVPRPGHTDSTKIWSYQQYTDLVILKVHRPGHTDSTQTWSYRQYPDLVIMTVHRSGHTDSTQTCSYRQYPDLVIMTVPRPGHTDSTQTWS